MSATDAAAVTDPPKKDPAAAVSPEEGLEKLKKQLADEQTARADEQRRREAAERRAQAAEQGEVQAKTDVQATQLDLVKTAITQLTATGETLVAKYAEAASAGDWTA